MNKFEMPEYRHPDFSQEIFFSEDFSFLPSLSESFWSSLFELC